MSIELRVWMQSLADQGVVVEANEGHLSLHAPARALSPHLYLQVSQRAEELTALSRGEDTAGVAGLGELIRRLSQLDIQLGLNGDKLTVNAPKGVLTEELREEIAQRKEALVAHLANRPTGRRGRGPLMPVARGPEMPIAHTQQRLWFLRQVDPRSSAYNIPVVVRLRGALDAQALQQALQLLLARHESLRTRFLTVQDEPRCAIEGNFLLELEQVHLSMLPGESREAASQRAIDEFVSRPFDLSTAPLMRAGLLNEDEQSNVFMVVIDHIVADGVSVGALMSELQNLYRASVRDESVELPLHAVQFVDYVVWEQQALAQGALASHVEFWKKELAGLPPLLQLPTDRPRAPVRTHAGARHIVRYSPEDSGLFKSFARQEGITLFMYLMSAFQVLMHRYSGQTDLAIGTAMANRNRSEVEQVVGFFANNVVIRGDLSGDPSFRAHMKRVRERALKAFTHRAMPFDVLVDVLGTSRELDRTPLFQVLFVMQHLAITDLMLEGLQCESIELTAAPARFDLAVDVYDAEQGLRIVFEYNTDLFDASTIERMAGHYEQLLRSAIATPDSPLSALPMLSEPQQRQLLIDWNATAVDYPREQTVHGLFEAQVARTPQAVAVRFDEQSLSYAELNARANRLAHHLRALGAGAGSLVGVWMERGLDMVVAILGILKAGAAYVPLDPAFPKDRIDYMMEDAALAIVVTQSALADGLPDGVHGVRLDASEAELVAQSPLNLPASAGPTDLAYVIYTSGSTGRPKGVMLEHRAVVNFLLSMQREPGITAQDRFVAVTTLSFDIAGLEIHGPLTVGGTVVLASRATALDGLRLAQLLERHEATLLQATPATWRLLLDSGWRGRPGMKMLCGGEGLPRELADKLIATGGELWNMYGPTETTIWSTVQRITDTARGISIGRPIANTQVYVLEPSGLPAPIGVGGELCIGGDGLARGYRNRDELTAEKFVTLDLPGVGPTRVYRTGDVVRFLADGRLEFVGRRDHQVKVRGFRIELGEIETVLSRHPGIKSNVVHVREDTPGDQRLVAYVVPTPGATPEAEAMRATLRAQLPEYMVPNQFVVLEAFPLTPNGKVDRKALPVPEASAPSEADEVAEALMSPVQRQVAALWRGILKLDRVGLHANFFDIGGHSLLLVRLQAAIKREFGQEIPLVELFQRTTVAAQADRLGAPVGTNSALERARARAAKQIQG
ncbi:MAG TPA: amino acid adenylation domain-containing protein [Hydrogenophaga sp.]|uniref:non-ribosomal peptide synthetase n=1 Tax=Hydrogenophaga sp. TaxID=1904254 RepID=UPI002D1575ED|nr:amino acid adenylation domain-containing protein [Hydrogenophaga sp.]HSX91436.1 amino acid adenylation domain-containing protein [Hydrogenophaga sp.]